MGIRAKQLFLQDFDQSEVTRVFQTQSISGSLLVDGSIPASKLASGVVGTKVQEPIAAENITGTDTALAVPLSNAPKTTADVELHLNGIFQEQGAGKDYTLGGVGNRTITWLASSGTAVDMKSSDELTATYIY